jgi:hypothetical protein
MSLNVSSISFFWGICQIMDFNMDYVNEVVEIDLKGIYLKNTSLIFLHMNYFPSNLRGNFDLSIM